MGVYADTLADINTQIDRTEFEIDAIEGTKSMTIYVYQEAANVGPSYTKYPRDGETLLYTHTGTGGMQLKMGACITFGLKFKIQDSNQK